MDGEGTIADEMNAQMNHLSEVIGVLSRHASETPGRTIEFMEDLRKSKTFCKALKQHTCRNVLLSMPAFDNPPKLNYPLAPWPNLVHCARDFFEVASPLDKADWLHERDRVNREIRDPYDFAELRTLLVSNLTNRLFLHSLVNIDADMQRLCAEAGCMSHPVTVELGAMYRTGILDMITATLLENGLDDFVTETLSKAIGPDKYNLVNTVAGEDYELLTNSKFRKILDPAIDYLSTLLVSNPGVVGAWVFALRFKGLPMPGTVRFVPIRHQGQVISKVAELLRVNTGTKAWKYLAKMPADEVYSKLIYLGAPRHALNGTIYPTSAMVSLSSIVRLYSEVDGQFSKRTAERIESSVKTHRSVDVFGPLYKAYLKESAKPTVDRGATMDETHREFTNMMDWATKFVRHDENHPEGRVLPNRGWKGLKRLSDRWHREVYENALAERRRLEIQAAGLNDAHWDSGLDSYVFEDTYLLEALTNSTQLNLESERGKNCASSYVRQCVSGQSRLFSILKITNDDSPHQYKATVELSAVYGIKEQWSAVQVTGIGNSAPPVELSRVIKDLVKRYNQAVQTNMSGVRAYEN